MVKKAICKTCGKQFNQDFIESKNEYTSFTRCNACRARGAEVVDKFELPYAPHETQRIVHQSDARFKILVCGNRWGKDMCAIADGIQKFITMLNEDRPETMNPKVYWWIIAPTDALAEQNWRDLIEFFPKSLIVNEQRSLKRLETVRGGAIEVRSAYDEEKLVGVGLDIVTITEAARVGDLKRVWENVSQRLSSPGRGIHGGGGLALINSTPNYNNPKSNNFLYQLFNYGKKGSKTKLPDYESFHFTTWDNPYRAKNRYKNLNVDSYGNYLDRRGKPVMDKYKRPIQGANPDDVYVITEEDQIKATTTTDGYKQDYLAEFILGGSAVFKNVKECMNHPPLDATDNVVEAYYKYIAEPKADETYVIGYDPASKSDGSPIVIFNSKLEMVEADPLLGLGYDEQIRRIKSYSKMYNYAPCYYGQAGVGESLDILFKQYGVNAIPVSEHGNNKGKLVNHMALLVELGKVKFLDKYDIWEQLEGYTKTESESGKTVTYSNGKGVKHDDWVSACYIALSSMGADHREIPYIGGWY